MNLSYLGMKQTLALLTAAALGATACTANTQEDLEGDDAELGSVQQATVTSQCLNYQRGVAGGAADVTLWESAQTYNPGNYSILSTGTSSAGFKRTLLSFNISNIPTGAHIDSATITLYHGWKTDGSTVGVHEVLAPWNEATVTWASFDGAFDQTASTSFLSWGGGGILQFHAESLVQQWVDGRSENHGLLLEELNGNTLYHSSEHATASTRPKLKVCYTLTP